MLRDTVKTVLRITHTKLDTDIDRNIAVARAEMVRSGISSTMANIEDDKLIDEAIITYCQYKYASNDKLQEGFFESWQYQLDNLRKSDGYKAVEEDV